MIVFISALLLHSIYFVGCDIPISPCTPSSPEDLPVLITETCNTENCTFVEGQIVKTTLTFTYSFSAVAPYLEGIVENLNTGETVSFKRNSCFYGRCIVSTGDTATYELLAIEFLPPGSYKATAKGYYDLPKKQFTCGYIFFSVVEAV